MTTTTGRGRRASRTRRSVLLLLPVTVMVAGCGRVDVAPPSPTVTLTVISAPWTGWSKEQPEPEPSEESVTKGSTFTRDSQGDEITFTVKAVDDDEVTLSTSEPMSPRSEDGGIDLSTDQTKFSVVKGETLKITTPTMDSGTTFEITYED